ncbi:hypothetical protein ACQFYA_20510 [Promicromonospora sp. Marseille-Q5078]
MGERARSNVCGLVAAVLMSTLAACSGAGDLSVINESNDEVKVSTGDEQFEVPATGQSVLLDYKCTPGDVTVEFTSGQVATVAGPVCSDEQIVIHTGEVRLEPADKE